MQTNPPGAGVLVLGEVLFDVFPDYRRIGGAPFNVAFHLHQLGIPVHFVSRIGEDDAGREVLAFCRRFGFPTEGIQQDPVKPTGEVRVVMDETGGHRFDILAAQAYDCLSAQPVLKDMVSRPPRLVYFGTLAQRGPETARAIGTLAGNLKDCSRVVVDINLRAPFYNRDVIRFSLEAADALKINDHELEELTVLYKLEGSPENRVGELMNRFHIDQIAVTRGPEGAELYRVDEAPLYQPSVEGQTVVDSVGAGDAFCALWMAGLYCGGEPAVTLEKAVRFAGAVCGIEGALPDKGEFYKTFRDDN